MTNALTSSIIPAASKAEAIHILIRVSILPVASPIRSCGAVQQPVPRWQHATLLGLVEEVGIFQDLCVVVVAAVGGLQGQQHTWYIAVSHISGVGWNDHFIRALRQLDPA